MKLRLPHPKTKLLFAITVSSLILNLWFVSQSFPSDVQGGALGLTAGTADILWANQIPTQTSTNGTDLSDAEFKNGTKVSDPPVHGSVYYHDLKSEQKVQDSRFRKSLQPFSCAQILVKDARTNKTAIVERNDVLKLHIIKDNDYTELANNCTAFISERGYFQYRVSQEEREFPLAYGIYMYKSVHQVEQLLRTIYRPQNVYCIHIDNKASQHTHKSMQAISKCFDNVFIASRLARVTWCSIEVVKAELYCLSDLFKRREKWKYYLNLSGQEFPLKTNLEIVQILKEYRGLSDVMSKSKGRMNPQRQKFKYFIGKTRMKNSTIPYTVPKPFEGPIFKGELHVALGREFVTFILRSEVARSWLTWLNVTLCPDEYFYQTLSRLPGTPGSLDIPQKNVSISQMSRAKLWKGINAQNCQGKIVRQICVYSWRDLPYLSTRPELFANKFHADYDSVVLECLSELIQNRTDHPIKLNLPFYRNFSTFRSWEFVTDPKNWIARDQSIFP